MPWGQRVAHVRAPDGNAVNLTIIRSLFLLPVVGTTGTVMFCWG